MQENQGQKPQEASNPQKQAARKVAWMLAGAGTEFALYIAAPLLVFLWFIEPRFNPGHKSKLFMGLGLIICLILSTLMIYRAIVDFQKKIKNKDLV